MPKEPPPNDRTRVAAFAEHKARDGKSITANVTEEHYELVRRIASMRHVSIANYTREAVLLAVASDLKIEIDLSAYIDVRDIASRYGMSKAELERVALADYMRRHSPEAQRVGVPQRKRAVVSHESGQYETPGPMPVARKVVSSAPPPRRRGR